MNADLTGIVAQIEGVMKLAINSSDSYSMPTGL
jgi:hypothetical protein